MAKVFYVLRTNIYSSRYSIWNWLELLWIENKVAIQLEKYLTENNLGQYPKGNTFIGRFPGYPVTLFFNPKNKQYVEALLESLKPYLKAEYHLEETSNFPYNLIKIYINGQPLFETSGKVTID